MTKMELPTPPHSGNYIPTIDHALPYKASMPIKIPTRSRHILSPTFSPVNRPISPELIFDMSPVNVSSDSFLSSDYNSSRYSPFVHRTLRSKTASASTSKSPPFMYPFPRPSTHHLHVKPDHFAPLQSPKSGTGSPPTFCSSRKLVAGRQTHSPLQHHRLTSMFEDDSENSSESQVTCVCPAAFASAAVTAARGRSRRSSVSDRVSALASPTSIQFRGRAMVPRALSPSRLDSHESCCFDGILPSTESESGMEAYMDPNVNPFDIGFGKHLMKRSEHEKRVAASRAKRSSARG